MKKIFQNLLKNLFFVLFGAIGVFGVFGVVSGQDWGSYNGEPKQVLDNVVNRLNDGNSDAVIWSELDQVNNDEGIYGDGFALSNTLDSVRVRIAVYLQRLSFLAMVLATILIIYNGLRLVLSPMQPEEAANIKKRLIYIILGLLVSTGFYFILQITLSVSIQATY